MKRQLILEDGSVYVGEGFGGCEYRLAEVIFSTGMSGYQEELTDLSCCAQIVVMTYPMVGNYGINPNDFESIDPAIFGIVVGEYCEHPSNFRSTMTLDTFLKQKNIPGIADIDTRALSKKLRVAGSMKGIMADMDVDVEAVVKMLQSAPYPSGQVKQVSTQKPFMIPSRGHKVVLLDLGVKQGIVRELSRRGCDLTVLPYDSSAEEILALRPDGVMLSNGPGDPKDILEVVDTVKALVGKVPMFGICLGHLLLALANGGDTKKMKFGHHGGNQPVIDLATGKVVITSQAHSFVVDEDSLHHTDLEVSYRALNDKSVEGIKHTKLPIMGVQFHPEATPGPEDTNYVFDEFMKMMNEGGCYNA